MRTDIKPTDEYGHAGYLTVEGGCGSYSEVMSSSWRNAMIARVMGTTAAMARKQALTVWKPVSAVKNNHTATDARITLVRPENSTSSLVLRVSERGCDWSFIPIVMPPIVGPAWASRWSTSKFQEPASQSHSGRFLGPVKRGSGSILMGWSRVGEGSDGELRWSGIRRGRD